MGTNAARCPAGSSAAWRLRRAGANVTVLDKARFPRLKPCAGWITPEVVRDLEIDPSTYPHRFLSFSRMQVHLKGLRLPVRCVQHSIRRVEFDAWLLERSGARVVEHEARRIEREPLDGAYVVDGRFRARHFGHGPRRIRRTQPRLEPPVGPLDA